MRNLPVSKEFLAKVKYVQLQQNTKSEYSEITLFYDDVVENSFFWRLLSFPNSTEEFEIVLKYKNTFEKREKGECVFYDPCGHPHTFIADIPLYSVSEELLLDYEEIKRRISGNDNQST